MGGVDARADEAVLQVVARGEHRGVVGAVMRVNVHNNGFCRQMLKNMAAETQSRSPSFKGQYEEKTYDLYSGIQKAGTAKIGYYGPFYYTSSDAEFLDTVRGIAVPTEPGSA